MYLLEEENLTGLGGPMGSERTWTNWSSHHKTLEGAKEKAVKSYGKSIKWRKYGKGIYSGDLLYVAYTISPVELEE